MAIKKLLDATKKAEQADKDRMRAIVEILNLQKELERADVDNFPPVKFES